MVIIKNKYFPKVLGFSGITLYPFIFVCSDDPYLLKHEMIHVKQIKRDGFFYFYFRYVGEYIINLVRYRSLSKAYFNISYEVEAYSGEFKDELA